ncbi:MAG TPA: hypothetical protein VK892_06450 [Pyrinomonadaceae bacterium]|nr:hypothetical protein [Pyrinomonadaceae bacterium]
MKIYGLIFIALAAIAFSACSGTTTNNSENAVANKTVENKPAETTPERTQTAAHSLDPTGTVKAFISAYQKKDVDEMKKYLSKGSLEMFRQTAELQGKTEKELMTSDDMPFKEMPEMRNEKIEGDTASVEVKVEGKWEKTPLVKENGSWKLAFDKS